MKKILFFAVFFCIICFTVESARLPGLKKTGKKAISSNINQEDSDSFLNSSNPNSSDLVKFNPTETSFDGNEAETTSLANLPDGKAYVGVISFLSLREEPFGKVLARLYNNDEVIIVNRDGDWYEVESEKGSGWVYGKCVFDSPNSNTKASASSGLTVITDDDDEDEDEDEDDDDDAVTNKSKGIYNYVTFNNPGDYKFTLDFKSTTSSQKTKPTKTSKTKTAKKSDTNTKKDKSSKSASKDSKKDTETISSDSGDHMKAAAYWVDKVYEEVRKNKCLHKGPVSKRFEEIKKKKRISCTSSASIVFQQAGMIPKGKIVTHTKGSKRGYSRDGFDKALKDSVKNVDNLIAGTCDIVMVMKKYKDCPKWLQRKGIFYIQKSNGCVSGDNGWIYSCNHTGHRYTKRIGKHNGYYQKGGYPKKKEILFAFVPRTNGKSNVPDNCGFKVKPAWGKGSGKIVGSEGKTGKK